MALTNKKLIGARDPLGIRPLVLGELNGAYILCSETCALDIIGARFVREIENGEVVVISEEGIESHRPFPRLPAAPLHLRIYLFLPARQRLGGRSVYEVRKQHGRQLAREAPADADVVVPVPDSGVPGRARLCAASSAFPSSSASSATTMSGRTFIEPTQTIRSLGVKLKHNANRAVVAGQARRAGR